MQGKASAKWTEGNLDKYIKSPADYAPGKFQDLVSVITFKFERLLMWN